MIEEGMRSGEERGVNPLRRCIEAGHEVLEDLMAWELCKERLFCCRRNPNPVSSFA